MSNAVYEGETTFCENDGSRLVSESIEPIKEPILELPTAQELSDTAPAKMSGTSIELPHELDTEVSTHPAASVELPLEPPNVGNPPQMVAALEPEVVVPRPLETTASIPIRDTPQARGQSHSERKSKTVFIIVGVLALVGVLCIKPILSALNKPAASIETVKPTKPSRVKPAEPGEVPQSPPTSDTDFASEQIQVGLKMKAFKGGFEAWLSPSSTQPQRAQGLADMKQASSDLDFHIKKVSGQHHAYALLWRGHWNLHQALILNVTGPKAKIADSLKDAASCFRKVLDSKDPLASKDLPDSLESASGTYKFLFDTKVDLLFQPIRDSLDRNK